MATQDNNQLTEADVLLLEKVAKVEDVRAEHVRADKLVAEGFLRVNRHCCWVLTAKGKTALIRHESMPKA